MLASAFVGTTIEWYDFFLYGTASALIFSTQFFPQASPLAGTVASFATLAVGIVVRPLGGIIAGHLGDRIGRKSLLVASLLLMGWRRRSSACCPSSPRSAGGRSSG